MAFPFAARQQFLEHGYAVVPNVLSKKVVDRLRTSAIASTTARARYFADLPSIYALLKSRPKMSDPLLSSMMTHMEKRRCILRYYRQVRRQKRELANQAKKILAGRELRDLSGDELWKLSEMLSTATASITGKDCVSTVRTDAQMLLAINEYRANAWMTNSELESVVRDTANFGRPLAELAEIVGGVEHPVVFGDVPLLRESYGNPVGYHCTALLIGTRTNAKMSRVGGAAPAVTLFVVTYTPSKMCLEPWVMQGSHQVVREQYGHTVHPASLHRRFAPMEADIRDQLRHFSFGPSITAAPLVPGLSEGSSVAAAADAPALVPGTVVVVDPHLMMGFGPNLLASSEVVYRLNVVDAKARPLLSPPSWIRGWRTMPVEVSFESPVVFPPLQAEK